MDILSKFLNPVVAFVATLVLGFWLSRRGRPYNGLLFNLHKLIALGAVIITAIAVYRELKLLDPDFLMILLLLLAIASVVALFTSGALMSANKGEYRLMKLIHNIAPAVTIVTMAYTVYLL